MAAVAAAVLILVLAVAAVVTSDALVLTLGPWGILYLNNLLQHFDTGINGGGNNSSVHIFFLDLKTEVYKG